MDKSVVWAAGLLKISFFATFRSKWLDTNFHFFLKFFLQFQVASSNE